MAPNKFYVVFKGHQPGIYETWADCQKQTKRFKGASFKSFTSYMDAKKAFEGHIDHSELTEEDINNSISVDASCIGGYPGRLEFNIVHTGSQEKIYDSTVYPVGEVNLGEFLVLTKALQFIVNNNAYDKIIFSDSVTAITWIKNKKAKPSIPETPETELLLSHVRAAERYLQQIDISKFKIVKWDTHIHGEIKADYGRK